MLAEKIKARALLGLSRDIQDQKAGRTGIVIDLSGIPAIRNRILFRAFLSFIEERCLKRPLRARSLAMNVVLVIIRNEEVEPVEHSIAELNQYLISQRHGVAKIHSFDLETMADRFVAFCAQLMEQAPPPAPDRSIPTRLAAPPDIAHLGQLIDIARTIGQADLSLYIQSQTIWRLEPGQAPVAFAEELWTSIAAIERVTNHLIHDDTWIFQRSTELLDNRVLSHLLRERRRKPVRQFLNLNPASIVGGDFRRLIASLQTDQVRKLTVEMTLSNWRADPDVSRRITALLRRNGISLAIDGLRVHDLVELTAEQRQAADFFKIDAAAPPPETLKAGLATLPSTFVTKLILCHCDTAEQIAAGLSAGLRFYQGRGLADFLDNPEQIESLLGRVAAEAAATAVKLGHNQ